VSRNGIPTTYGNVRFRSRLEARWACFFDLLGWRWEYEPLELAGWLPDFALVEAKPTVLVEVKPELHLEGLRQHVPKIERALEGAPYYEVLLVGASAFPFDQDDWDYAIGLHGGGWGSGDEGDFRDYHPGHWIRCNDCGRTSFYHSMHGYYSRLCGHWDGDHHLGEPPVEEIQRYWTRAGNVTQWKPAA
jgi:hypothetical protein